MPARPRPAAALVALFVLVIGATNVHADSPTSGLSIRRVIDDEVAHPGTPFQAFDAFNMNLADLRGDGHLELVSLNDNLKTYIIDPNSGSVLAELSTPHGNDDATWMARDINGVAIADVQGDPRPELAVLNGAGNLTLFALDGPNTAGNLSYKPLWRHEANALQLDHDFYATHPWIANGSVKLGADGNPAIVRLPKGAVNIIAQSDGFPLHVAYNADGTVHWYDDYWDGNAGPWVGSLVQGGPPRIVFSTDGGHVVMYDAAKGIVQWDFNTRDHGATPGSMPITPTVVDLDGHGEKRIFVGARQAVHTAADDAEGLAWMKRQHAVYFLLDQNGTMLWNTTFSWGNPMMYMHPAATDIDGDGTKDLIAIDWNTIGHHPGNWEGTGDANLFAISGRDGHELWHTPIHEPWSNKGLVVGDFLRGKGTVIVAPDMSGPADGLGVFDLHGKRLDWYPIPGPGWSITRAPVAADIDADGYAELIVPVAHTVGGCTKQIDVGCRQGALLVYSTAAPDATVRFGNNFLSTNDDDGHLPIAKVPPGDVTPAKLLLGTRSKETKGLRIPGVEVGFLAVAVAMLAATHSKR